ncbi:hypothetical protein FNZ07_19055 [Paraburkholderia megapolitana]|nr:hypothetical protein FNZ07_19055 [Paraburkholderia megapolitana]
MFAVDAKRSVVELVGFRHETVDGKVVGPDSEIGHRMPPSKRVLKMDGRARQARPMSRSSVSPDHEAVMRTRHVR